MYFSACQEVQHVYLTVLMINFEKSSYTMFFSPRFFLSSSFILLFVH